MKKNFARNKKKRTSSTILAVALALALCLCGIGKPIVANAKGSSSLETILNSAQLHPAELYADRSKYIYDSDCLLADSLTTLMGDEDLNKYTNYILSVITTPEMTTYQRVKACYDWLIEHYEHGGVDECYGYMDCYGYTDAFVYLTRAIGLDSYFVHGDTCKATGGFTNHAWAVIIIDGVEYVFDPDVEDKIAKGGKIGYYRFGKTYAEVPDKYILGECQLRNFFIAYEW